MNLRWLGLDNNTQQQQKAIVADEGASIPNEVFNLVKSIVGAGVLGFTSWYCCFWKCTVRLGSVSRLAGHDWHRVGLLFLFDWTSLCLYRCSYRDAWKKSVGERGSWLPALRCLLVTVCPRLLDSVGMLGVLRTQALLGITTCVS
jgi:hypothetical protein